MIQTNFIKTTPDEWLVLLGTHAWEHPEIRTFLQQMNGPTEHMATYWERTVDVTQHHGNAPTPHDLGRLGVFLKSIFEKHTAFTFDLQLATLRHEFDLRLGKISSSWGPSDMWALAISRPIRYVPIFPTKKHKLFQPNPKVQEVYMAYGRWFLFTGEMEVCIFDVAYSGLHERYQPFGPNIKRFFGSPPPEIRIKSRAKSLDVFLMQAEVHLLQRQVIELCPTLLTQVIL